MSEKELTVEEIEAAGMSGLALSLLNERSQAAERLEKANADSAAAYKALKEINKRIAEFKKTVAKARALAAPAAVEDGSGQILISIDAIRGGEPHNPRTHNFACDECGGDTGAEAGSDIPAWIMCEACGEIMDTPSRFRRDDTDDEEPPLDAVQETLARR
jgi:hypothetical protein